MLLGRVFRRGGQESKKTPETRFESLVNPRHKSRYKQSGDTVTRLCVEDTSDEAIFARRSREDRQSALGYDA